MKNQIIASIGILAGGIGYHDMKGFGGQVQMMVKVGKMYFPPEFFAWAAACQSLWAV
jgi:hypothetical protein